MIVRFNSRALVNTVERRSTPVGVEGDPPSIINGGVSETEAIVGAAKKTMPTPESGEDIEAITRVSTDMIVEEEQAEPGPELDPEGLNKAREKADSGKEKDKEDDGPGGSGNGGNAGASSH